MENLQKKVLLANSLLRKAINQLRTKGTKTKEGGKTPEQIMLQRMEQEEWNRSKGFK